MQKAKNRIIYKNKELKEEITRGLIGTGMCAKNANGEIFELSVVGDFNGDGTIDQI